MICDSDLKGFAVQPKLDCPHLYEDEVYGLIEFLLEKILSIFLNSNVQLVKIQHRTGSV